MLRVGLTGGIACGKSRVRRRLAAAGFGTLDLDAVAHEMIAPGGPAYADVVAVFGRGILAADGTVDRKILGTRVFGDAAARAELNALVHPRVRDEEAVRAAAHAAAGGRVFVTDAALLVEAGLHLRFDRLVVVDCEGGEQVRRLMARDRLDETAAHARIAAQMSAAEKRRFAHLVLDASGTLEATDAEADGMANELALLAERAPERPPGSEAALARVVRAGPARGPHGLHPARWVEHVSRTGQAEMEEMKRLLDPPVTGPWYRASETRTAEPVPAGPVVGADALSLVVGMWSLGRRGLDPVYTASAMFSVARLTDGDPERTAGACLVAVAAAHFGALPPTPADAGAWTAVAESWARAPVPEWARVTVDAALAHPRDARAAAEASRAAGGHPELAAGLVVAGDAAAEGTSR